MIVLKEGRFPGRSFWTPEFEKMVSETKDFGEIAKICLSVARLQKALGQGPVHEVCGPISNGGFFSIRTNLAVFGATIDYLYACGRNTFDQRPLQTGFQNARDEWNRQNGKDPNYDPILELVYRPLFESGLIGRLVFLPNWQSSRGAIWEMDLGKRLGLDVVFLSGEYFEHIVRELQASRTDLYWPQ